MSFKLFTPVQATQMLPLLVRIVREIRACTRLRDRMQRAIGNVGCSDLNHVEEVDKIDRLTGRIEECAEEVESLGCQLGCAVRGVVNFPGQHAGRDVLLTWQPGDATVGHYFETEETFHNRRPVHLSLEAR